MKEIKSLIIKFFVIVFVLGGLVALIENKAPARAMNVNTIIQVFNPCIITETGDFTYGCCAKITRCLIPYQDKAAGPPCYNCITEVSNDYGIPFDSLLTNCCKAFDILDHPCCKVCSTNDDCVTENCIYGVCVPCECLENADCVTGACVNGFCV